jgi:quinol-cytochrome oxidoreductase complex cytochrome b subunit
VKPFISLVLAVAVAAVAQFVIEPWADRNDLVHWLQHGILFWSGVVAGIAMVLLYRRGRIQA